MPIISHIGRRSPKVVVVFTAMYALLAVGAITMLYPLLLMISGSMKSETDFYRITPIPRYLWDDDVLWQKYVEAKYGTIGQAETAYRRPIGSWRRLEPPPPAALADPRVDDFEAYREREPWPRHFFSLGHTQHRGLLAKNARAFRRFVRDQYDDDITAYSHEVGIDYDAWYQVELPIANFGERTFKFQETQNYNLYYDLKGRAPVADRVVIDVDGLYWANFVRLLWADVAQYNAEHGTDHADLRDVLLATRPPPDGRSRDDWEQFVRDDLNLAFIRVDRSATARFREFVRGRFDGSIDELNHHWGTDHSGFGEILLPDELSSRGRMRTDLVEFIRSRPACPLEMLSTHGPRQALERFVADRRGVPVDQIGALSMPVEALDYRDFQRQTGALRWEFATRNYIAVLQYILMHSNGIRNTIIFCALMVLTQLIVNPLAAYALSRYRPPSTYQILLFCMCTMAFPGELTMIPGFLLLKRFPLVPLAVAVVATVGAAYVIRRALPKWSDGLVGVTAALAGLAAGFWAVPVSLERLGASVTSVSLLNTFWALILPGAASGFSIFLLKGFFDSLPQELYEAAELDGAGEWTKFWTITMSLSKPILAVLALGAFTAAYSEFMMALVIIPDPEMWTIMIWLYQLQSHSHPSLVYASLVVAAIPTMLIFLFCQKIIMRGIVVPVER
ncbi:MAG: hypothetical protein CMJ18_11995 [Phycisphaeraceae bacterium]|nr:hypothetical protein [Phycisphaeraceae bacterium]